jgi:hypothetical protein
MFRLKALALARGGLVRLLLAALLGLFAFVYQFNTLGGTLGGLKNDHFVPFAYAKQVQAGEQVLVDFDGLGLQGAWPSLTYEVSAFAQKRFGSNLRTEALLCVGALAFSVALTFVAASLLAPMGWAFLATLVSLFVAPALYNYPKVLVLSSTALLIGLYARKPSRQLLIVGAGLTAVAFLFRHDLAAYAAVGLLLCFAVSAHWRHALGSALAYGAITLSLLTPSLWYVQRHEGLIRYFQDGLRLSVREADRTELNEWPRFHLPPRDGAFAGGLGAFFDLEENAVAWLYYVARVLPLAAVFVVWRAAPDSRRPVVSGAVIAISGMMAFSVPLLVRGNVAARLGDVGPLLAVGLAVVCHALATSAMRGAGGRRIVGLALLVPLVAATVLSVATVGIVWRQLGTSGLRLSLEDVRLRASKLSRELESLPQEALVQPAESEYQRVAQYLNQCTAPSDRVVGMTYEPQLLPLAGRLFGGGRLSIIPAYALDDRQQRAVVHRWERQDVPLALVEFTEFFDPASQVAPIVRDYLLANYEEAGQMSLGVDRPLHVFVRRGAHRVSTRDDGLPCLR